MRKNKKWRNLQKKVVKICEKKRTNKKFTRSDLGEE